MNVNIWIISLLVSSTCAGAQQPGSVRGTVTSVTGEPLRKAEVVLRGTSLLATETDPSGNFFFGEVSPGNYAVTATRVGFLSLDGVKRSLMLSALKSITVAAGQEVDRIAIKLTPHSVISGKVVDDEGDPIYAARVTILEETFPRGRRTLLGSGSVTVDDLGEYRIAGLQPGRYYVSVEPRANIAPRARAPGQESDLGFVPVYFPGVVDPAQASPIQLEMGQAARGIDIRLRRVPVVNVRGKVIDGGGLAVPHVGVTLVNADNVATGGTITADLDGSFVLARVARGSYVVWASSLTKTGRTAAVTPIQVDSRDVDMTVRLLPPGQVSGVIRGDDNLDLRYVRVTLDPMAAFPPDMLSSDPLGEGNAFRIGEVTQGRYRVYVVNAPEGYYAKAIQWNGEDVTDSGLSVTSAVSGVEIVLAKGATTVQGSLLDADGKKVAGGAVTVVPPAGKRDDWSLYRTAIVDQNGSFTVRNLPPGEYIFFGGDVSGVQNPEYLKQVESKGKVVKLGGNATETVELKVID